MELLQFQAPPAVTHHSFGSPVLEPHTGHQQVIWANYLFFCSKLVGCLEIYLNLSSSLSLKVHRMRIPSLIHVTRLTKLCSTNRSS